MISFFRCQLFDIVHLALDSAYLSGSHLALSAPGPGCAYKSQCEKLALLPAEQDMFCVSEGNGKVKSLEVL